MARKPEATAPNATEADWRAEMLDRARARAAILSADPASSKL